MKKIIIIIFSIILVGSLIIGNPFKDNVDLSNKDKVSSEGNVDESSGLITFTVEKFSFICKAENGMTWEEWCSSQYNNIDGMRIFEVYGSTVQCSMFNSGGTLDVLSSDVIEDGVHYLCK